jgi:serine/threonine protein kinase
MADSISLDVGQSVKADSGYWYKNIQVLGEGGNATTFLVVGTSGDNKGVLFAMKVFRRLSMPERGRSFFQEVAFLKECTHPCIMRVFDEGQIYSRFPFVIVDYLPRTLHEVMRSHTATTTAKLAYSLQLLSALQYLSGLAQPVIHRDIKPQNIFIKGHACVLGDFGLMKRQRTSADQDRPFYKESIGVGMPYRYRTPDLVDYLNHGTPPTSKSDVFQLGLVLAEFFTGRNPLKPADSFSDAVQVEPLAPIPGAMGRGIANLIGRMLVPTPSNREPASKFLDPWQGVFLDAVNRAHALEGKVF